MLSSKRPSLKRPPEQLCSELVRSNLHLAHHLANVIQVVGNIYFMFVDGSPTICAHSGRRAGNDGGETIKCCKGWELCAKSAAELLGEVDAIIPILLVPIFAESLG